MKKKYNVIGLMSGTSLDGLDIAYCTFTIDNGQWKYAIQAAETIPYPPDLLHRLSTIENSSARELALLDADYGHYLGQRVREFMAKYRKRPDFIASHGHTIFHQPDKGMTLQIGKGSAIAAETGLMVINDFRVADVAFGGQGAPAGTHR